MASGQRDRDQYTGPRSGQPSRLGPSFVPLGAPKRTKSAAVKLAVPKPVNLPSLRKENAGNDPTTQLVPSGHGGWSTGQGEAEVQRGDPHSSLVEKATWASGQGPSPPQSAHSLPPPQTAWERARALNLREFPSLSAVAGGGGKAPAGAAPQPQPDVRLPQHGGWDDDERGVAPTSARPGGGGPPAQGGIYHNWDRERGGYGGGGGGGGGPPERDQRPGGYGRDFGPGEAPAGPGFYGGGGYERERFPPSNERFDRGEVRGPPPQQFERPLPSDGPREMPPPPAYREPPREPSEPAPPSRPPPAQERAAAPEVFPPAPGGVPLPRAPRPAPELPPHLRHAGGSRDVGPSVKPRTVAVSDVRERPGRQAGPRPHVESSRPAPSQEALEPDWGRRRQEWASSQPPPRLYQPTERQEHAAAPQPKAGPESPREPITAILARPQEPRPAPVTVQQVVPPPPPPPPRKPAAVAAAPAPVAEAPPAPPAAAAAAAAPAPAPAAAAGGSWRSVLSGVPDAAEEGRAAAGKKGAKERRDEGKAGKRGKAGKGGKGGTDAAGAAPPAPGQDAQQPQQPQAPQQQTAKQRRAERTKEGRVAARAAAAGGKAPPPPPPPDGAPKAGRKQRGKAQVAVVPLPGRQPAAAAAAAAAGASATTPTAAGAAAMPAAFGWSSPLADEVARLQLTASRREHGGAPGSVDPSPLVPAGAGLGAEPSAAALESTAAASAGDVLGEVLAALPSDLALDLGPAAPVATSAPGLFPSTASASALWQQDSGGAGPQPDLAAAVQSFYGGSQGSFSFGQGPPGSAARLGSTPPLSPSPDPLLMQFGPVAAAFGQGPHFGQLGHSAFVPTGLLPDWSIPITSAALGAPAAADPQGGSSIFSGHAGVGGFGPDQGAGPLATVQFKQAGAAPPGLQQQRQLGGDPAAALPDDVFSEGGQGAQEQGSGQQQGYGGGNRRGDRRGRGRHTNANNTPGRAPAQHPRGGGGSGGGRATHGELETPGVAAGQQTSRPRGGRAGRGRGGGRGQHQNGTTTNNVHVHVHMHSGPKPPAQQAQQGR